ncbi:hypothetical protein BU23DRAFT_149471 [Bimuria novae-zelandiae CBS 107.79]|uniref:Uncharacterized protein n=1 Tax=Bimuria novae-zelandiae CBS 107.79 TaxID=1447943 RepID=A0A6A5VPA7_9PLEO|nr:hypothetical protein BU23DRAFT_149471 [Bimuria novae-zelandiae CBS 107.79]
MRIRCTSRQNRHAVVVVHPSRPSHIPQFEVVYLCARHCASVYVVQLLASGPTILLRAQDKPRPTIQRSIPTKPNQTKPNVFSASGTRSRAPPSPCTQPNAGTRGPRFRTKNGSGAYSHWRTPLVFKQNHPARRSSYMHLSAAAALRPYRIPRSTYEIAILIGWQIATTLYPIFRIGGAGCLARYVQEVGAWVCGSGWGIWVGHGGMHSSCTLVGRAKCLVWFWHLDSVGGMQQ